MNRETQLAIDKLKKENIQRDAMEYGVFELAAAWAECDAEAYKYILKNNKKIKRMESSRQNNVQIYNTNSCKPLLRFI